MVLDDWVDGGWKSRRHGDDFIAGFDAPVFELGGSERGKGNEVGGRAGVHQQNVPEAKKFRHAGLKFVRVAPRRQPEIEGRIHEIHQFRFVEITAGVAHRVFARTECFLGPAA